MDYENKESRLIDVVERPTLTPQLGCLVIQLIYIQSSSPTI